MLSQHDQDVGNAVRAAGAERPEAGPRPEGGPRHRRPHNGAHPRVPGRTAALRTAPAAQAQLERWLTRAAAAAGCPLVVARSAASGWASATFTGARHELSLSGEAGAETALHGWLARLQEAEVTLRGHLVADLVVTGVECDADGVLVRIEALTVEA